ncbi:hypothetical protein IMSAGC011_02026 [Lachnospiraceae bacterium]|nr:hypothetical protein IMSAGC011_02026 [Lachnospiraceae bacterium]
MNKSAKYYELQALDLWDFPALIKKAREIQGITLEDLCRDICSSSLMGRIEKGERYANKELRDRILARLGVCSDGYENFLFYEDYLVWKQKQRIVNTIEKGDFQTAQKLLESYEVESSTDKLGRQFCMVMRAQILQKCYKDKMKIAQIYEEAVKLTIPEIDGGLIKDFCLSVQELDMVLEYERYCHPDRLASRCKEILAYISSEMFDTYSYVKIYPKVIYYLYISTADKDRDWNYLLRLSSAGIEQLRTTGRMYYLWELLEIRKEGLTKLLTNMEEGKDNEKKRALQTVIDTTEEWMGALDFVHTLCGTDRKMETSCYLYQQKEAYCISDVIRRRREMLGLTKKELCKGICSEKTIGRLEAKKTKPQIEIVRQLFERLNLSGEYQRWQIVTQDVRAFAIVDKIGICANNRDFKELERLLIEIQQYASMDNLTNKQYRERIELNLNLRQGKMTKEEARQYLVKILEYTLPYKTLIKIGQKYLTNLEIQCALDIAINLGKSSMNDIFISLYELCKQMQEDEGISEHIAIWEMIMTIIASIYGNLGEYDKSDTLALEIMTECIRCYRMNIVETNLYCISWNNQERGKKNIPLQKGYHEKTYLKKCIVWCKINKNTFAEKVISDRLSMIQT